MNRLKCARELLKDTNAVYCDSRVISNLLTEEGICECTGLGHREVQIFSSGVGKYCLENHTFEIIEPRHEISNNVVCATSKGSDQPAHTRRLIRAFASRLNIL